MATISERLAYVLTFDTSSGVKSLQQFGSTADREIGKAGQKLDKLGGSMTKFGAGAMAFAGLAGAGLFKLASGAADAQANMSALEQVVGETVAQDVGTWAEDSAKGVGMASKDAVGAATSFAQLGKIIGLGGEDLSKFSTDLVTLSADFAAFKNVTPEQALQDIQAGFAGSTEVMRKYGIFLDDASLKAAYFRETGEQVSGTLTAQQKIVAINSELYRQGADMLGQWGRESGELAGQQATLKAEMANLGDEIGAGVLPHLVKLMGVAGDIVGVFGSLDAATNGMVGSFAAYGVAALAVGGSMSFVAGQLIKMRDTFVTVRTAISTAGAAGVAASLGWAAAVVGVGAGVLLLGQRLDDLNKQAMDHSSRVREVQGVYEDLKAAMASSSPFDVALDQIKQLALESPLLTSAMREAGISLEDLATAALGGAVPMSGLEMQLLATDAAAQAGASSTSAFGGSWQDVTNQIAFAGDAVERVSSVTEENIGVVEDNADAVQEWSDIVVEATQIRTDAIVEAYESEVDAAKKWADEIRSAVDSGSQSFMDVAVEADTSAQGMIDALNGAAWAASAWESNLETVAGNVTAGTKTQRDEFVAYLAEMGEAGAPMVADLSANTDLINPMFEAWVKASAVTGDGMIGGLDPVAGGMEEKMLLADGKLHQQMLLTRSRASVQARLIGDAIPDGVELGITQGQSALNATITSMIDQAIIAAKSAGQIESPSKLFADDVGTPIVEGIAEGIDEDSDKIADAIVDAIEDAADQAIEAAEQLVEDAQDVIGTIWDGMGRADDFVDQTDAVAGAERDVADGLDAIAEAEAELARLRAMGDTPDYERIEDAQRGLERATRDHTRAIESQDDAARSLRRAEEDLVALRKDGTATARQLEDAEEAVSDAQIRLDEATQATTDAQREQIEAQGELNEALNTPAVTAQELAEAEAAVEEAKRKHADAVKKLEKAYRKLAEEQADMLEGTPEEIAAWEDIARQGGYTEEQILHLAAAYRDLAAARAEAEETGALADDIRSDAEWFADAARDGVLTAEQVAAIGAMSPADAAAEIARHRRNFESMTGVRMHAGGTIPGAAGAEVPILAQAGERVLSRAEVAASMSPAEMSRAVSEGMVAGWRRVQQMGRVR